MAKSVLDIVINLSKQGGADKETIKGLVQVKSAILSAAAVAGTLVAAGYTINKAFEATAGVSVELANKIRSIKQVTGLTAEESSKLVQVSDDLKVSFEDLYKVMQKNGDLYDYSTAGLAAMSDEYLALASAKEKAAYMEERFGRSWGKFVEFMEQGSGRIIAAGDGINKALIFDDAALQSAREYEKNLDNVSDGLLAMKVTAGNEILPILNTLFEYSERYNEAVRRLGLSQVEAAQSSSQYAIKLEMEKIRLQEVDAARWNGLASIYESQTAHDGLTSSIEDVEAAMKNMNDANREFLSTLGSVQSAEENYQSTVNSLNEERISLEEEKQKLLTQGWWEESEKIQDINAKLEENSQKAKANADEYELANHRIMLGLLERKLAQDGVLDDAELQWLLEKGVAWGVYSQTVVDETARAINEANGLIEGLVTEKTFTLSLNTLYSNYGNSDGGARVYGNGARNAAGTHGFRTVPPGHPGDTFPVWLTSREQYAVIPAGGDGSNLGVSAATGGGGGAMYLTINYHSLVNTASREEAKRNLLPLFEDSWRNMQARGVVK